MISRLLSRSVAFILMAMVMLPSPIVGCSYFRRDHIVEEYRRATCVPRSRDKASGEDRAWNHTITLRSGEPVEIAGFRVPSGKIAVTYSDGKQVIAADAGDYLFPTDVRVDSSAQTLFVRTHGSRAFGGADQTWIIKFDMEERRESGRMKVDPTNLPEECR